MKKNYAQKKRLYSYVKIALMFMSTHVLFSQVILESEVKITDLGLHFNGNFQSNRNVPDNGNPDFYDFVFGRNISAHGDCIKTYGDYVFMTWYRGGKTDRHVMLTRYNTVTGTMATIEFPHRHTGFQNKWWLGESHNAIAVGVSPLDGTIHLLYDMHSYSNSRPSDGSLSDDYFRYSYSIANVATLPDVDFTLDKFVQNSTGGYKHLSLNGGEDYANFSALTYPKFFLNDTGDLFMYMREGGNNNGAYKFSKYTASTATWSSFTDFNVLNARSQPGITYNWGLYGDIKYVNGKMRIGFQRRSSNNADKYQYQNGVYYAYSDDQSGKTGWKNHQGQSFALPLYDADFIKVIEPGDYVQGTNTSSISIVGGFDWTVTEQGDVHIISEVKDNQFNVRKYLHTYKPAGASDFITSEDFAGGSEIYTSGDDIFLIGLTSGGQVFVEKAQGGTNNFTRVYEGTSGKVFDHGAVYINNGKLYYYLMHRTSGSAQPLYLQIIDLDIIQEPFRISLTSPSNGETYNIGETIQISADAVDENGIISKVEFMVNGAFYAEDTTAPYSVDWSESSVGAYTVHAVAYNASNETVLSSEITVNFQINDPTDLTGDIYRIKNFVTGKYLHSVGSDVVESNTSENDASGDKEWEFVKAGDFYNIESKRADVGILRAAGNPPNDIINTGFGAPREDSDKQWTIIAENDGTYRFKTRNGSNFLYHDTSGVIEHSPNTDDMAKWFVESTTLSVDNKELVSSSIKVYPNPAKNKFTIAFKGFNKVDIVIYDILGKPVYKNTTHSKSVQIDNDSRFKSGIYLLKVVDDYQRVYHTKLVIK